MAIGLRIKQLRVERGWTLEDLSRRSGVDVGTINALERRNSRRSTYFVALAKAFGLSFQELADGVPPPATSLEDKVESAMRRKKEASDKWFREAETMLLGMTPVQRAQMVANMRSFKQFLDRV